MKRWLSLALLTTNLIAQNRPERVEWFRDQGFGLFIHWSLDSQLGSVISHSMVGASPDYLTRFIDLLPRTFNPRKFYPEDWAVLARLAGIRYVVFTTKHHAGFTMWPSRTTEFSIANTPYRKDIVGPIVSEFRKQGIAPGFYFSPDDFLWLHKNGKQINRNAPGVSPAENPDLMKLDQAQLNELLTGYGDIDVLFIDGPAEGLKETAWRLQPNIVVTRGAMETPEQYIPGMANDVPWEACLTMGTQWQYKPTNDIYKSGGELISILIETRAKGGNLLLNVGPKPDGELPIEQEERLREIALWMFINGESIYGVRPWVVTNEHDVWFTKKKNEDTVYAIVKTPERWRFGAWRDITLGSIRATAETTVTVLGQNDQVLEYQPKVVPKTTFQQMSDGLHIRAMHAQRIYNDRKWPNPIVLKLTNVKPALDPPRVTTLRPRWNAATNQAAFNGKLLAKGDTNTVQVGFEYRDITGQDITERLGSNWKPTSLQSITAPGDFSTPLALEPGRDYEVRALVKHPLLTTYGPEMRVSTRR